MQIAKLGPVLQAAMWRAREDPDAELPVLIEVLPGTPPDLVHQVTGIRPAASRPFLRGRLTPSVIRRLSDADWCVEVMLAERYPVMPPPAYEHPPAGEAAGKAAVTHEERPGVIDLREDPGVTPIVPAASPSAQR